MNSIFKKLLLTAAFIFCISMTASAQHDKDGKKPPPEKRDPPVVVVEPKKGKSKDEKPRNDDNRGKKPQVFFLNAENIIGISFV